MFYYVFYEKYNRGLATYYSKTINCNIPTVVYENLLKIEIKYSKEFLPDGWYPCMKL